MDDKEIRIGDVVHITARITGLRGDGSFAIEPVGFDYDTEGASFLDFYTVDPPILVERCFKKGDMFWAMDGEQYEYWEGVSADVHLIRRVTAKQDLVSAWQLVSLQHIKSLKNEDPHAV